MKTRDVILGICALLVASGSAFASLDLVSYTVRVDRGDGLPGGCPEESNVCVSFTDPDSCTGGTTNCTVLINGTITGRLRDAGCDLTTTGDNNQIAIYSDACITAAD